MYRYYQASEWSDWVIVNDEHPEDPWYTARQLKAARVTVLSLSGDPLTPTQQGAPVKYHGPLYFDIDNQGDLPGALASSVELCNKLKSLGVHEDQLEIHLSGSKGVHVYISPQVFSKQGQLPHANLPEVYATLAWQLWVEGLDMQVYSAEKGRMFRPANAKRPDDKYKVRVTYEELCNLTEEGYREMVKAPRKFPKSSQEPTGFAKKLGMLFESALTSTVSRRKAQSTFQPVPEHAFASFQGGAPSCVTLLAHGNRRQVKGDSTTSFNNLCIQMACWAKAGSPDPTILETMTRLAVENNPSSKGVPEHVRKQQMSATMQYVKAQPNYTFSCGGIKKLLSRPPECESCHVNKAVQESPQMAQQVLSGVFLSQRNGNYYADKDASVLVAPIGLSRDSVVRDEDTNTVISSVMLVHVPLTGQTHKVLEFSEEAWLTKLNLKKELQGIEGAGFFGSDNDVVRLRLTIARDDLLSGAEVKTVHKATKLGINYRRRTGPSSPRHPDHKGRFTYVEPDFTLNDVGVPNTHIFTGSSQGAPRLGGRNLSEPLVQANNEAFRLLLKSNAPHVLCYVLPWFLASHIKQHIYTIFERFPLLCVSGIAGTGKNATAKLMMRLCGLEGEQAKWTLEAPNCTKWPFQEALSNSSTIPRVINEFNPKSMDKWHYGHITEMLKAAYDSQTINKGAPGSHNRNTGPVTNTWRITAPVMSLSEEPPVSSAVIHRALMVNLDRQGLQAGKPYYIALEPRSDDLTDIGRVLVKGALTTPISRIITLMDKDELPEEVRNSAVEERIKYNFQVLLCAYDWAYLVLEQAGMSKDNLQGLLDLRATFCAHITDNVESIRAKGGLTEVDKVLKVIMLMANPLETHSAWKLEAGVHYTIEGEYLYLDTLTCYPKIQLYNSQTRTSLGIQSEEAFNTLVRSMSYFVSDNLPCRGLSTGGRPVLCLDMQGLVLQGLPIEMFFGGS